MSTSPLNLTYYNSPSKLKLSWRHKSPCEILPLRLSSGATVTTISSHDEVEAILAQIISRSSSRGLKNSPPVSLPFTRSSRQSQKPLPSPLSAFKSLLIRETLKIWPCFGRTFLIEHWTAAAAWLRLLWFGPQIDNGSAKSRNFDPNNVCLYDGAGY